MFGAWLLIMAQTQESVEKFSFVDLLEQQLQEGLSVDGGSLTEFLPILSQSRRYARQDRTEQNKLGQ